MFSIIWMLIAGFIVGALARFLMPGDDTMNWTRTLLLGVAGSVVGGLIGRVLLGEPASGRMLRPSFGFSVVGAVLLLWIWRKYSSRSAQRQS